MSDIVRETRQSAAAIQVVGAGVFIVGLILLVYHFSAKPPRQCVDTVTMVSVLPGNPSTASCRAGMTMTTKARVQGVEVTCTCPRAK